MNTTQTLAPVALVTTSFADQMTAQTIFRADGEAFAAGMGKFFITSVALYLYMGNEPARECVRTVWADSKHKSREYALKIFRMCAAAIDAGQLEKVRAVQGFADLHALVPKKEAIAQAAKEGNDAIKDAAGATPDDETRARMERAQGAISRAADIANAMDSLAKMAERLSFISEHGKKLADVRNDAASAAADLNVLRATLAELLGTATAETA